MSNEETRKLIDDERDLFVAIKAEMKAMGIKCRRNRNRLEIKGTQGSAIWFQGDYVFFKPSASRFIKRPRTGQRKAQKREIQTFSFEYADPAFPENLYKTVREWQWT